MKALVKTGLVGKSLAGLRASVFVERARMEIRTPVKQSPLSKTDLRTPKTRGSSIKLPTRPQGRLHL
ncbi:MAG: hypothetical protein AAF562_02430 [Pseudomonadota bacterium]